MKSKPRSAVNDLLAVIQRQPSHPPPSSAAESPALPANPSIAEPAPSRRRPARVGKPIQFWFHDEDRRLVRELAAWLAGQGIRSTDSTIVRASLRMARPGEGLLEAYRDAVRLDGRLKPNKTTESV